MSTHDFYLNFNRDMRILIDAIYNYDSNYAFKMGISYNSRNRKRNEAMKKTAEFSEKYDMPLLDVFLLVADIISGRVGL